MFSRIKNKKDKTTPPVKNKKEIDKSIIFIGLTVFSSGLLWLQAMSVGKYFFFQQETQPFSQNLNALQRKFCLFQTSTQYLSEKIFLHYSLYAYIEEKIFLYGLSLGNPNCHITNKLGNGCEGMVSPHFPPFIFLSTRTINFAMSEGS